MIFFSFLSLDLAHFTCYISPLAFVKDELEYSVKNHHYSTTVHRIKRYGFPSSARLFCDCSKYLWKSFFLFGQTFSTQLKSKSTQYLRQKVYYFIQIIEISVVKVFIIEKSGSKNVESIHIQRIWIRRTSFKVGSKIKGFTVRTNR